MDLHTLTIAEAASALRNKSCTSRELAADCLRAIRENDGNINAYLDVHEESAMRQAEAVDEMIASGAYIPPLAGIPLAVKDNIMVEGRTCTAGSRMLERYTASFDATVVKKLKNQGAVIMGKTNLDEFAMGSSTENSAFGPTKNPRDVSRVPGGSSGGSAAAVAADMCLAALGSDTGGSIRQPASFCGIVGFKPTYGAVSRHGLIAMASSLDQIGPMTKTVADAELLFHAIAGKDDFDSTSSDMDFPDDGQEYPADAKAMAGEGGKAEMPLTIGIPKEYFSGGLETEVEEEVRSVLIQLEEHGAKLVDVSLPHSSYALAAYYVIVCSEVSANLARFDGIRYGHQSISAKNIFDTYSHSRGEGFGAEVKRRIMLGTYALSAGYYDAYYLKAQKVRRLISEDFDKAFARADVLLGPTTPTKAFAFGEKMADPLTMYLADMYTVAANLAGVPAISLPAAMKSKQEYLPAGIQLIAPRFREKKLFAAARHLERVIKMS